ncbi:MAG TPA: hypothetical protein VL244_15985 [Alphaproteobacteria bacterium]|nr:hypothetical protein [Alphaproteobacteria bacterium]
MEPNIRNLFVGVSTFAVALLYFYALALSVVVAFTNTIPWYVVLGAWLIVSVVLYFAKDRNATRGGAAAS